MLKTDKGTLFVFSGPSGTGKGTILSKYYEKYNDTNIKYSVSATTRLPRDGETDGVNYYFKSTQEFETMIANDDFLEWAKFCDNYYGTPKKQIMDMLSQGIDVILEIETIGAMKVKSKCPQAVLVFVLPPSLTELKRRLTDRGTEAADIIEKRSEAAIGEIKIANQYDYILINDDIDTAVEYFRSIVTAQRLKVINNKNTISEVLKK